MKAYYTDDHKDYTAVTWGDYGPHRNGEYTCKMCGRKFPFRYDSARWTGGYRGWTWFFLMAWNNFDAHLRACQKKQEAAEQRRIRMMEDDQ